MNQYHGTGNMLIGKSGGSKPKKQHLMYNKLIKNLVYNKILQIPWIIQDDGCVNNCSNKLF